MTTDRERALRRVFEAAPGLHDCPLAGCALEALARRLAERRVERSLETGCGASTLVFALFSSRHIACTFEESVAARAVAESGLLDARRTEFLWGPTQLTLPRLRVERPLDAVLLDGPHAYPFPDLEYYHLYPKLRPGALLAIDDIHIPTVRNLYRFLRADAMFRPLEVVDRTAFFERTEAPCADPHGDGWELQGYNRGAAGQLRRPLRALRARLAQRLRRRRLTLDAPTAAEVEATVGGLAAPGPDGFLWLLARRDDQSGWWPQNGGPVALRDGRWQAVARLGEPSDAGWNFELAALIVRWETHERWLEWTARARREGPLPPTALPARDYVYAERRAIVRKECVRDGLQSPPWPRRF